VIDASALVELLLRTGRQEAVEHLFKVADVELHVPALCDLEVAAAVRRVLLRRLITQDHAGRAIDGYLDLPISRHGHELLLRRILDLRDNLTAYDASYVALAEALDAVLVTGDGSLARAVRAHTRLEMLVV